MRRMRLTPEAKLANYWRRKSSLEWSDFDVFQGVPPPAGCGNVGRSPRWLYDPHTPGPTTTLDQLKRELAHLIARGFPLNFAEYHCAIACSFLLADGIPYEEFYRHHWYETATKRGYGSLDPARLPRPRGKRRQPAGGRR